MNLDGHPKVIVEYVDPDNQGDPSDVGSVQEREADRQRQLRYYREVIKRLLALHGIKRRKRTVLGPRQVTPPPPEVLPRPEESFGPQPARMPARVPQPTNSTGNQGRRLTKPEIIAALCLHLRVPCPSPQRPNYTVRPPRPAFRPRALADIGPIQAVTPAGIRTRPPAKLMPRQRIPKSVEQPSPRSDMALPAASAVSDGPPHESLESRPAPARRVSRVATAEADSLSHEMARGNYRKRVRNGDSNETSREAKPAEGNENSAVAAPVHKHTSKVASAEADSQSHERNSFATPRRPRRVPVMFRAPAIPGRLMVNVNADGTGRHVRMNRPHQELAPAGDNFRRQVIPARFPEHSSSVAPAVVASRHATASWRQPVVPASPWHFPTLSITVVATPPNGSVPFNNNPQRHVPFINPGQQRVVRFANVFRSIVVTLTRLQPSAGTATNQPASANREPNNNAPRSVAHAFQPPAPPAERARDDPGAFRRTVRWSAPREFEPEHLHHKFSR